MYEDVIGDLRQAYDRSAARRDAAGLPAWKIAEREEFLTLLRAEGKRSLLEIGAGPGHFGAYFRDNGLNVTCTDLSPEMVRLCREKGLTAHVMDFLHLDFPPSSFDAIFALNCLLHVPSADLPRVLARIEEELAASQGVVIFAEGTSWAGDRVLPFRSPLLELPARIGRPVHWAAIGYRAPKDGPPTHLAVTWWAEMPLGPHLRGLLRLPRVDASIVFGGEPVVHLDRKRLAEELWQAVDGAFEPVVATAEVERLLALRETDPAAVPPILRDRPARAGTSSGR